MVLRCLYRREFLDLAPDELLSEEQDLGRERGFALALVDRNILRLALYELLYTDTPPEVVIDEAVELAKEYGTEQAPKFINGILDRVWKEEACEPS